MENLSSSCFRQLKFKLNSLATYGIVGVIGDSMSDNNGKGEFPCSRRLSQQISIVLGEKAEFMSESAEVTCELKLLATPGDEKEVATWV